MCENGRVVIAVALVALAVSLVHREQTGGVPPMKDGCTYTSSAGEKVYTVEELAEYDGSDTNKKLLLVVLGQVFDVSKGAQHYGHGKGYNIFAGQDASRAFVSGEFDRTKDYDPPLYDVSKMENQQLIGVDDWRQFYHKEDKYVFVGFLYMEDGYYTCKGEPTQLLKDVNDRISQAYKDKDKNEEMQKQFPGCNSHYAQGKGGRVWCGDEDKVPRLGKLDWDFTERCACYTPIYAETHRDRLNTYKGCNARSNSCDIDVQ